MSRASLYHSKPFKASPWQTPGNVDNEWDYHHQNSFDGARDVFEEIQPDSVDTGILDGHGNPIYKTVYRNGIGFHAEIPDD